MGETSLAVVDRLLVARLVVLLAGWTLALIASAQSVTGGDLRSYSTPQSIGFEWSISGDQDHDATVGVRYRAAGEAEWRNALDLFRIDFAGQNMMAGSILFLRDSVEYQVELALTDPDGGSEVRDVRVSTGAIPVLPMGGRTLHVEPGLGGGDGSEGDPFRGIEAADAAARPGDILLLEAGDYGGQRHLFDAAGSPGNHVVWRPEDPDNPPVFDDIRVRGDYIWIEGFDISAPNNAVRNEGDSVGAAIIGNRISGCHYCIHLNAGAAGWWISDNTIVGTADPSSGSFSGEGVELQHTPHHTVAYNSISRVGDGISYPDRNVDIFGNDIFETSDDGIEADDGYANIRVWGNRIHHAHNNGISFQPMNGAPWYILRNQVIGSSESVLKVRTAVDRVLLAHNTFVAYTRVFQSGAGWIRNMTSRNNLWVTLTGDYLWEDTGQPPIADNWRTDLDYDGFAWPASTSLPVFKWHGVRYPDLAALQLAAPAIEQNAIAVGTPTTCFDELRVPGPPPAVIPPHYARLSDNCNAVDAGQPLANVNDGFIGAAPDLGAHETGAPLQHYGPRDDSAMTPPTDLTVR